MRKRQNAFLRGWDDCFAGTKRQDNPYPAPERPLWVKDVFCSWSRWRSGWDSAYLQKRWMKRQAN